MTPTNASGKSTAAVHLAGELVHRGKKVLIIDMDISPHDRVTDILSITQPAPAWLSDVIVSKSAALADTICHTCIDNLDLIPGGLQLTDALASMQKTTFGRDTVLRRLLPQIPDTYDYVFFDCSSYLEHAFSINVLVAAQYILAPIQSVQGTLDGYDTILEAIQAIHETVNPGLRFLGIFLSAETNCARYMNTIPRPEHVLRSTIRRSTSVQKAALARKPLAFFSPNCAVAADYAALCDEILNKMEDA